MLEPRLYRAAFLPAVLAVVLAMFSLESRPNPLPQGLAADVLFDGRQAAGQAEVIVDRAPNRRAGSLGDAATAELVAQTFADRGFSVERDTFRSQGRDLVNVAGRRPGRTREQVVVVAARDAPGPPDRAGSAADTAALMELARVFEGRSSERTLVLASVDGGRLGQAGARRFARRLKSSTDGVAAVLVVSGLGAPTDEPPVVSWSGDTTRVGIGLERTAAEAVRLELDVRVEASSVAGQLSRLAFPLGVGAQGVFLDSGLDSLRFTGSGEQDPPADARLDPDRLGGLGRAALRTLSSLDSSGAPQHGPRSYVTAVSQVLPGWVVSVLAIALLLPAIVASVDAFARARRRRQPVLPGLRDIALVAACLLGGLLLVKFLTVVGATPGAPPAAVDPSALPFDAPAAVVLGGVLLVTGGLLFATHRFLGGSDPTAPGTGCAAALVLCAASIVLWVLDPYAALLAVPAVHLWMLALLLEPRPTRRVRVIALLGGLLPAAIVALYYSIALSLNPLHGAWYLLMLAMGGTPSLATLLVWVATAAAFSVVLRAALVPDPEDDARPDRRPLRAVPSYAGPGSLGGTESAIPRR